MCAKCHSDRTDRRRNRKIRVERNLMRNININFHFRFHRERHTKQVDTQRRTNERKYEKLFCCDDLLWDENLTTTQRRTHSHSSWRNRINATCDMPVYKVLWTVKSAPPFSEQKWCDVCLQHIYARKQFKTWREPEPERKWKSEWWWHRHQVLSSSRYKHFTLKT